MKFPNLRDLPLPSLVTRAPVPDDIDAVTSIHRKSEVNPESVGVPTAAVDEIWAAITDLYRSGIHPAMQICLRRRGEIILDRAIGYAHGGGPLDAADTPKVLATPETPFNVFSASKPMAAMAIHLLDERNLIHLDDPVCEYIPEFAQKGKQWVTIRHILIHRAGIPTPPEQAMDLDLIVDRTNREAVRLLCEADLSSRAGGRLAYHAITGGFILGEIVRRVSGKPIEKFVDENIRRPMGWRWMNFGVAKRDVDRVATNYFTGLPLVPPMETVLKGILGIDFVGAVESSNDPRFKMGVLPAANLMTNAREMSEFYELLRMGGELRGKRIFDPKTVWRATSEQSYMELDFTLGVPLRYGMGFMLGGDYLSLYGLDTKHAFGHLGFTNVVCWTDPVREISGAILNNGKPVLYPEMPQALGMMQTIARSIPKDPLATARMGLNPEAGAIVRARSGKGSRRAAARPGSSPTRKKAPAKAPSKKAKATKAKATKAKTTKAKATKAKTTKAKTTKAKTTKAKTTKAKTTKAKATKAKATKAKATKR